MSVQWGLSCPYLGSCMNKHVLIVCPLTIPLCMISLLEVTPEVTGDNVINYCSWIGKPDGTQLILVRELGWSGGLFWVSKKGTLELWPSNQASYCCLLVLLPGSSSLGQWKSEHTTRHHLKYHQWYKDHWLRNAGIGRVTINWYQTRNPGLLTCISWDLYVPFLLSSKEV